MKTNLLNNFNIKNLQGLEKISNFAISKENQTKKLKKL